MWKPATTEPVSGEPGDATATEAEVPQVQPESESKPDPDPASTNQDPSAGGTTAGEKEASSTETSEATEEKQ